MSVLKLSHPSAPSISSPTLLFAVAIVLAAGFFYLKKAQSSQPLQIMGEFVVWQWL